MRGPARWPVTTASSERSATANRAVAQAYLWALPIDGSAPRSLTNGEGAKSEIRFRYVRTEPIVKEGATKIVIEG